MLARAIASATPAAWPDPRVQTTAGRETVSTLIRPMTPLGQFRNTFIIAIDDEGIAIIDQHVAHERILFEQISERLTSRALESQRLLTPVVLDLPAGEHQTLLSHRDGARAVRFRDRGLRRRQPARRRGAGDCSTGRGARRRCAPSRPISTASRPARASTKRCGGMAATMACHAAVKANDPLTREKMQYLLDELRRTSHSSVCPHGRPVVLRLTRREIERNFDRI